MSEIKERPILFSAPMVTAILGGRKTVTRKIMKLQPCRQPVLVENGGDNYWANALYIQGARMGSQMQACPYGQPVDRLWVRESFWGCDMPGHGDQPCVVYDDEWSGKEYEPAEARPWARRFGRIPSAQMPRDASRVLLEITSVSAERLRDTGDIDLLEELGDMLDDCDSVAGKEFSRIEHLQSAGAPLSMLAEMYGFKAFWDKANGAGSFDTNPWVWVIKFKQVTP